ncbi:PAS domain-containing sensor histidine kinase [Desulforhopalus singaporensis]|uniref:histidine kinase n=1 Tax=Desulforhopalus singaporensis TaxID=91360 RepID=A0A1H0N4U6_9BACT|nr:ATP-binding protein [Desulforhopalus singaporensis]SDO87410.1 His Kinase A (phospho-acceptor) domain-containing protein [Desulforhopalus singaporensis]
MTGKSLSPPASHDGGLPVGVGEELFHSIQDPLLVVTPLGKIVAVNDALLQAVKKPREAVIGNGICKIIHGGRWPHIKCPLEEFLLTRSFRVEDTRLPGLGGEYNMSVIPVSGRGEEEELILLMARKLTQEEVRKVDSIRTSQLAALGELAAGVAHEVNNPINGIINFAQLLLDDCEDEEQSRILERIVMEGERIATITYNLLSFARENVNEHNFFDLNEVVTESLSLVEHQLKNDNITVEKNLYKAGSLIYGNHLQLMQVILNIISNSRFALKERYREDQSEMKISFCSQLDESEGQKLYRLVIRDNGTGVPQGVLDKMFDPFFTSKPPGQGSGLGLSISYGIIKNHGGVLRVDSILNNYTEMIIEIPAAEK